VITSDQVDRAILARGKKAKKAAPKRDKKARTKKAALPADFTTPSLALSDATRFGEQLEAAGAKNIGPVDPEMLAGMAKVVVTNKGRHVVADDVVIEITVPINPRKEGSWQHQIFGYAMTSKTVGEYKSRGGTLPELLFAWAKGHCRLGGEDAPRKISGPGKKYDDQRG
jgi:hypothetical protein